MLIPMSGILYLFPMIKKHIKDIKHNDIESCGNLSKIEVIVVKNTKIEPVGSTNVPRVVIENRWDRQTLQGSY